MYRDSLILLLKEGLIMAATAQAQIRLNADIKKEATALFRTLGLDLSSAINIFLRQSIMRGGLPFSVELPSYNRETLLAMAEAKAIAKGTIKAKKYQSAAELFDELDAEDA